MSKFAYSNGFFFKQEKAKDGQSTEDGASAPVPSYVKHPLQNKWALWFFKNDKTKSWQDNLRLVTSFDTVSFAINLLTLFCCYDRYMIHYCMQLSLIFSVSETGFVIIMIYVSLLLLLIIVISSITVFAGVLFVHQPGTNHAPRALVT